MFIKAWGSASLRKESRGEGTSLLTWAEKADDLVSLEIVGGQEN